jgi:hypothetical protein
MCVTHRSSTETAGSYVLDAKPQVKKLEWTWGEGNRVETCGPGRDKSRRTLLQGVSWSAGHSGIWTRDSKQIYAISALVKSSALGEECRLHFMMSPMLRVTDRGKCTNWRHFLYKYKSFAVYFTTVNQITNTTWASSIHIPLNASLQQTFCKRLTHLSLLTTAGDQCQMLAGSSAPGRQAACGIPSEHPNRSYFAAIKKFTYRHIQISN